MRRANLILIWAIFCAHAVSAEGPVLLSEFIYDSAPFPSCHASTLVEVNGVLAAAWFGGTDEGNKDVGIWFSRRVNDKWEAPAELVNGIQADGSRHPCWNPVLFQPRVGPLFLFYKVGPSPSEWWGCVIRSPDGGKTWSKPAKLPDGVFGPIKNKPVQLADGLIVSGSSTEHAGWRAHFELSSDGGSTWSLVPPLNDGKKTALIQPTILTLGGNKLSALFRTRQAFIFQSFSEDAGKTWSDPAATILPNPSSGIDAVTLSDKRHVLIFNNIPQGRSPLNVAVSADGKAWRLVAELENMPGEFSYPAVIQTADGRVHVTYTWNRKKIKHVVLDQAKL